MSTIKKDEDALTLPKVTCLHPPPIPPSKPLQSLCICPSFSANPISINAFRTAIITITTGPDAATQDFLIHSGLLCFHAHYIRGLLKSGFKETHLESVRTSAVSASVFDAFFYWMCTRALQPSHLTPALLIEAYLFANFHLAHAFKNIVIDQLSTYDGLRALVRYNRFIFNNTVEGDTQRQLAVELGTMIDFTLNEGEIAVKTEKFHKEFLFGVLKRVYGMGRPVRKMDRDEWVGKVREGFCGRFHGYGGRWREEDGKLEGKGVRKAKGKVEGK